MTQPFAVNPYGTDFAIAGNPLDLDPGMRVTSGRSLLSQSLACRFSTPRGACIDCPNDGMDLRDMVSDGLTLPQLNAMQGTIQNEALKDVRVKKCTATLSFSLQTSTLTVVMNVESLYGPFQFTLAVTSVSVTILDANLPAGT